MEMNWINNQFSKGSGDIMAGIQWNSTSINSFFRTSLNQSNSSPMSGIYNSINNAAQIKNGGYSKLMKSYYTELKKQQNSDVKEATDKLLEKKKTDSISKDKTTTDQNTSTSKKDSTYNNNGTKNQTLSSFLDELI